MYSEKFNFVIVSENSWIEQALREVTPLEDSIYTFSTFSDLGKIGEIPLNRNTAVIVDDSAEFKQSEDDVKCFVQKAANEEEPPFTAVVFTAQRIKNIAERYRDFDRLWPVDAMNDATSLKEYFAKLAADMKERADAAKQAICFQTLIDSSKDLIWFKDTDGRHLIVNDEFCNFVSKSKKQIYKQGHCYIWNASKEDEKVCLDSDRQIMIGKRTQKFEEQVHTNWGDYIIQSYKSPLTQHGEIFGTCGIGQNITKERNLERKLNTILDHIPFAIAVVSNDEILTYKNRMFDTYFPQADEYLGKNVGLLKQQLHFPKNSDGTVKSEFEIQIDGSEQIWVAYYERKILDAFDSQIEKMLILQDITPKKDLEKQKEIMANTDYLTGLSNRRGMLKSLENENDICGLTVIMLDIDDFKIVNDSLGHVIGDEVLKKFAAVLEKIFASDFVVRYGGDEFLIVTRLKKKDVIREKLDSLLREAEKITYGDGNKEGIHVSCGILVGIESAPSTMEQLIEMSDEAMYYIKRHGKYGYQFYDEMNGMN